MPVIYRDDYGKIQLPDGVGYKEITPTTQGFVEGDGTDVRVDRVREYDEWGNLICSYLVDKMGCRFEDNLPGI